MPQTVRSDNTRRLMLLAAERLFADQGIEAVTLRDIGRAAGQRNNSVVHYHFGTKEALVDAALRSRYVPVDTTRHALLDRLEQSNASADARSIVHAVVQPLAALLEVDDGGRPLALLAQLCLLPRYSGLAFRNDSIVGSMKRARDMLGAAIAVPSPTLRFRFNVAALTATNTLAGAERQSAASGERPPQAPLVENLVDITLGIVSAPVSDASREAGVPHSTAG